MVHLAQRLHLKALELTIAAAFARPPPPHRHQLPPSRGPGAGHELCDAAGDDLERAEPPDPLQRLQVYALLLDRGDEGISRIEQGRREAVGHPLPKGVGHGLVEVHVAKLVGHGEVETALVALPPHPDGLQPPAVGATEARRQGRRIDVDPHVEGAAVVEGGAHRRQPHHAAHRVGHPFTVQDAVAQHG